MPPPRHCAPARSLRGTKQSIGGRMTTRIATARHVASSSRLKAAPRNGEVSVTAPPPRHRAPAPSLRPRPVISRNESIHRRSHENPDCHRCAPRNDEASVIAPPLSSRPPPRHCEERSNPSAVARQPGLPRRCAPRNDEVSVIAPPPRHRAPARSLRGTKQSIGGRTKTRIATAPRASQ